MNLPENNTATLFVKAWSSGSVDQDSFMFSYSTDEVNYLNMFSVENTRGSQGIDNVFVDQIFIRSEVTQGTSPLTPTNLTAAAVSAYQVHLDWTDNVSDEYGYHIKHSLDGTSWALIDTIDADANAYADLTVQPDTTYYYRVRAYNGSGISGYSNVAAAITPGE